MGEAITKTRAGLVTAWSKSTAALRRVFAARRADARRADALTALETAAVALDRLTLTGEVRYARTRLDAAYTALVVGDVVAVDSLYCAPPWAPPSPPSAASPAAASPVRMCSDERSTR